MTKRAFLAFVVASLLSVAQAQTVQRQQNANEVEVLRAQLETMESYNERLLATVYWSLGGVFTVVVLVAGFGWFANFRLYERDKETLTQELKSILSSETRTISDDIKNGIDKLIEREVEARLGRINHQIGSLQLEQLSANVENLKSRGDKFMALFHYPRFLEKAIELDREFEIGRSLDEIRKLLGVGSEVSGIDAEFVAEFYTVLAKLPTEYQAEADDLKILLRNARGQA